MPSSEVVEQQDDPSTQTAVRGHERDPAGRRGRLVAIAALVLAAVNLRLAVTSVGPLLGEIRTGTGMSSAVAGLLASVPVICFATIGVAAPRLAHRFGAGRVVLAGLIALTAGLAARPFGGGTAGFLALSVLALGGIAVVNVLLPMVVKERFPGKVGTMTGVYSVALNLGATVAAGSSVPLTGALGGDWRLGLASWALVALVALPPWLALARDRRPDGETQDLDAHVRVSRHPVAWALAGYFGLQSTSAYVIIGWLPQIYRDAGLSAGTAGLLFAVTSLLSVPLPLLLSAATSRWRSQSWIAVTLCSFGMAGWAGLWASPAAAPWVFAVLLGVANVSFPLVLTMIAMRGRTPATVVRLSAFTQSVGYVLAIPGPILVGVLHDHTGGWRVPLAMMVVLMAVQGVAGFIAGRDRQI